ncbi:ABC transporter substrate-binding protein [Streptomyces sp. NPDC101062]|uniref:ABC transporter substrate-binding protein n=1 Tax=unclassified Streptomyces TaxID=2593676 RepID=UPI002E790F33|nr:extracellular solute-binding protein [Streptomyces sp. JV176]MEE1802052.1 extracellular solute-binding protein [Streptomyces sp. JV176]
MRKKLIPIATVLSLALTGCAFGGESSAGGDSDTLKFWLSGDGNQGGGFAAMAKEYTKETGVKIDVVDIPYDDLRTKLRNAAQANDLPALARVSSVDPLWTGSLLDLTATAEKNKVKANLLAKSSEGEINAVPTDLTAVGLFINKSLFDKAKVPYPKSAADQWTWDEFTASLKKVQQSAGAKYGMVMDRSSHRLRSFLYQHGSNGFGPDASGKYAANPRTTTALESFKAMNDDKLMPRSVWLSGDDANALFKSGQVAAYYSGVWQITDFSQNIKDFEWKSVLMPKQPVRATNLGTNYLVGFDGPAADKTSKFIDWLYTPENYRKLCEISGFLPVEDGVEVTYAADKEAFGLYNDEIAESAPINSLQMRSELTAAYEGKGSTDDPIRDETVKYLNGDQDVRTTVSAIEKAFTEQAGG